MQTEAESFIKLTWHLHSLSARRDVDRYDVEYAGFSSTVIPDGVFLGRADVARTATRQWFAIPGLV